jgi:gamma-glutamyltranspeptidase/glutathione hydrolase
VPGSLRGIQYLYDHYATVPWVDLIAPAIHLARHGFIVNADLVYIFEGLDDQSFLVSDPAWATDFAPNGTLLGLGDRLTRRRYADLLQAIADGGPDVFYEGTIAEATISALRSANGTMTMADLREYDVTIRTPLQVEYRGFTVTTVGAPASGSVVLNVLKSIEGYQTLGDSAMTNISTHRFDEAIRFGYGAVCTTELWTSSKTRLISSKRTELGDPSFFANITSYEQAMLTEQTASEIRSKILDNQTQPVSAYDPSGIESLNTPGTSHISAADHSGLAVSLTSTINLWFGSRLIVPETGLIMNNEMNDFSIPGSSDAFGYIPSPMNFVTPGKRPMSSMSPTIVDFPVNKTFFAALGASGGSYIITAVMQTLSYLIDYHMSLPAALATPRLHDQLMPNIVELEYAYDNATAAFLVGRGHNVTWAARESVIQGLLRHANGTFVAAADPVQNNGGGVAV